VKADVGPGRRVVRRVEAGAGEPAVVLEAGLNNGAASWQRVMPLLAPQGRHVVVDGTGHNIPRDRPDAVADTILAVAAQARASGG
jgi:hypothetical protein